MKDLTNQQLQDLIISLQNDLFDLQRNAEIHNVLDSRLVSVKELLMMARKELGRR